ncbi:MAG: hypothetical protein ACRD1G_11560 [Acidimicrobiales bacterium]
MGLPPGLCPRAGLVAGTESIVTAKRQARGFLPLRRVLFHHRLRRTPARKVVEMLGRVTDM